MKKVAINGLGRIGRLVLRQYCENRPKDVEIVAVNDLVSPENLAYLLRFDSVHGRAPYPVTVKGSEILMKESRFPIYAEKDPARLPWKELGVDVVLECTGMFTKRDLAAKHVDAGAKRVIISAPSPQRMSPSSRGSTTTSSIRQPIKSSRWLPARRILWRLP